ncbi:PepSY-like domain-containing protein [Flammeovirga agarivorans]|uniref:Putative beta-lactamase-inhibitor-like PepSY-like domain-containing protein n=1 Tax=Flammeovirga agarivorans TaxID=2726742 RepID=A0A7X8SQ84_9BACT|nr:PepSY-like domain-containing protein [Flammeovirga agarivorans]NLR94393.1 hypothetical protein [Flammeovirga agarivorans]
MKKTLFIFLFTCLISSLFIGCDTAQEVNPANLPDNIYNYIEMHFPDAQITSSEIDDDGYEVTLDSGYELEFNGQGDIDKIEALNNQPIPPSCLEENITEYVENTFPGNYVVEWEDNGVSQEVKVSNGVEIIFDAGGHFMGYDE